MDNIVVDTNVWITAGKLPSEVKTIEEVDCIEACLDWSTDFMSGEHRILVDSEARVFDEYWTYVSHWQVPGSRLFELYNNLWDRFETVEIKYDDDGYAILPETMTFHGAADRKFIALALSQSPFAPIFNASDTDWEKELEILEKHNLTIHELCPKYIEQLLRK